MKTVAQYKEIFDKYSDIHNWGTLSELYDPMRYIMSLGGKRIRPILVLFCADAYGAKIEEALEAALAVETFHNFTLMHDDIMDQADMRRNQATVHKKYDSNTAILSGDMMLIRAYQLLNSYGDKSSELLTEFNKMAEEVCQGQRLDMNYETQDSVAIGDYIEMIRLKTAVLIGASMALGAQIADANAQHVKHIYNCGVNLGIMFQIQDDYLDIYGAPKFGKRIGGDIVHNKKTYLYLKSLELLSPVQATELRRLYKTTRLSTEQEEEKISAVRALYDAAHVNVHVEELKLVYSQLAQSHLEASQMPPEFKAGLLVLINDLLDRKS